MMCIACELGYWAMIDALEAERAAKGEVPRSSDAEFVCDVLPEWPKPKSGEIVTDEQKP